MRILSKRQLKELVLYSPQHIARLEQAGAIPKRVQLGPNRVGWVEDEVIDWAESRRGIIVNADLGSAARSGKTPISFACDCRRAPSLRRHERRPGRPYFADPRRISSICGAKPAFSYARIAAAFPG